jgi:hypothetical protein
VKFADADAGPPSSGAPSGLTPSDSCYAKHLPAAYGVAEVQRLFEPHGGVVDVKLFPCLDQFRGASALVRMASVPASERAISALNNATPPGALQSLVVRFAESPAEKAARLMRRERQHAAAHGDPLAGALAGGLAGMDAAQLQHALAALSVGNLAAAAAGLSRGPSGALARGGGAGGSAVCVKGAPPAADRLWAYENFARFGGVLSVRVLVDEHSGLCAGTVYVSYAEAGAAERARAAMGGARAGERALHVVVQGGPGGGALNGGGMAHHLQQHHHHAPQHHHHHAHANGDGDGNGAAHHHHHHGDGAAAERAASGLDAGDWQQLVLPHGAGGAPVW